MEFLVESRLGKLIFKSLTNERDCQSFDTYLEIFEESIIEMLLSGFVSFWENLNLGHKKHACGAARFVEVSSVKTFAEDEFCHRSTTDVVDEEYPVHLPIRQ